MFPSITSLYPEVLAELGGHADQEDLTLSRDSFMEVVPTAASHLQVHRGWETENIFLSTVITPSLRGCNIRTGAAHNIWELHFMNWITEIKLLFHDILIYCIYMQLSIYYLHNLLVFCWRDKVSKYLLDYVFAFCGLWHYKRWAFVSFASWRKRKDSWFKSRQTVGCGQRTIQWERDYGNDVKHEATNHQSRICQRGKHAGITVNRYGNFYKTTTRRISVMACPAIIHRHKSISQS